MSCSDHAMWVCVAMGSGGNTSLGVADLNVNRNGGDLGERLASRTREKLDDNLPRLVGIIQLNVEKTSKRLGRLKRTTMMLRAVESNPSRDRIVAWVREELVQRRWMQVCQIRALNRRDFLIVFQQEQDLASFLEKTHRFINGKLVLFMEWNGEIEVAPMNDSLKVVWIELENIPPFMEDQTEAMMAAVGPMAYSAVDRQE
ncbi:hypothetical protein R1sor_013219 [Riccia sorocarpa]|uniref:DUF4283 domain-containing protein n=1 Tax=Riccia sorocarpa TaxID=122646 RepID=A0ABD3H5X3_9MARC